MNSLIREIDDYINRGGRWVFWACPDGCDGMVYWHNEIATCGVCGRTNNATSVSDALMSDNASSSPKSSESANP